MIAATSIQALDILSSSSELLDRLRSNADQFRTAMTGHGFTMPAGEHPIVPIMLGDAKVAKDMADRMLAEGVYVIGFSYPVVPQGQARIRVQLSAAHQPTDIDRAVAAFVKVRDEMAGD